MVSVKPVILMFFITPRTFEVTVTRSSTASSQMPCAFPQATASGTPAAKHTNLCPSQPKGLSKEEYCKDVPTTTAVEAIVATFSSRASSHKANATSVKLEYNSCISLRPLPIRSISVLINVMAAVSEIAIVLIRRVLLKMSVTKLPRTIVITRYVLCS